MLKAGSQKLILSITIYFEITLLFACDNSLSIHYGYPSIFFITYFRLSSHTNYQWCDSIKIISSCGIYFIRGDKTHNLVYTVL